MSYTVKLAETEQEYLGIRRLNHRTFASELGQHETTADELLADRFEHKSRYIITLHGSEVIGMVATTISRRFRLRSACRTHRCWTGRRQKSWKSACWRSIRPPNQNVFAGLWAQ